MIYDLNTNKHALLYNIELRTMNEENNSDAGLRIIESEVELEERRILGGDNLIKEIDAVMMTNIMPNENDILENEVLIPRKDSQSPNSLESPMGSVLSLNSEQSSEREGNDSIVSMTSKVKILKFEDTLSEENRRQFEIIYESLLLEGKVISSETFQNRRKMEYGVRIETKLDEKNRLLKIRDKKSCKLGIHPTVGQKTNQLKTVF